MRRVWGGRVAGEGIHWVPTHNGRRKQSRAEISREGSSEPRYQVIPDDNEKGRTVDIEGEEDRKSERAEEREEEGDTRSRDLLDGSVIYPEVAGTRAKEEDIRRMEALGDA
jgi:hypothetical protein